MKLYSLVLRISLIYLNLKFVASKAIVKFFDEIQNCENYCAEDECFEFFDLSQLKVLSDEEDETIAYLNGTWVMNIHLNSPAVALVWAEKRYGTKWSTEAFYRRYTDACKSFKDPLDPSYPFFKDHKNCPYDKGDKVIWNMHKIALPLLIPPTFIGEWRINLLFEREYEGKVRKQCKFFREDVFEE